MMENNTLLSHELEEMRAQIGILKDKLEKQNIVNERHIHRSMKNRMSDINKTVRATIFAGLFATIFCPVYFYGQGCSVAFVASTAAMLVVCVILTIVQKVTLGRIDLSRTNLIETAEKLSKVRKHYKEWHRVAIPMIIIWLSWLVYEMSEVLGFDSPIAIGFYCGAGVGCIIGGIVGARINRRVIRQANEILSRIEELQKEN